MGSPNITQHAEENTNFKFNEIESTLLCLIVRGGGGGGGGNNTLTFDKKKYSKSFQRFLLEFS